MLFTPGLWVPLVNIQNTYILPGIPRLFQQMVEAHAGRFQGPAAHERVLFTNMGEGGGATYRLGVLGALQQGVALQHNHLGHPACVLPTPLLPLLLLSAAAPTGDIAVKLGAVASLNPSVRIGSYPNVELSGEGMAYRVRTCRTCGICFVVHGTPRSHSRSAHQRAPLCLAMFFPALPAPCRSSSNLRAGTRRRCSGQWRRWRRSWTPSACPKPGLACPSLRGLSPAWLPHTSTLPVCRMRLLQMHRLQALSSTLFFYPLTHLP